MSAKFKFVPGNYSLRNRRLLETGLLLASVDTFWLAEAEQHSDYLLISEPMILNGEYTAGVYTASTNTKMLAVKNLQELQQFSAVSSKNWTADWDALESLKLIKLVDETSWTSQISLVKRGFIDFMLAPLNVKFMIQEWELVAVPEIAIALKDSRHFVFSKHHPLGEKALEAANKGIKLMRQNGTIYKAYSDAQFFYREDFNLRIINP